MICISTSKLLIITWVVLALLIGLGIGYLSGINRIGQPSQLMQAPQFNQTGNQQQGGQQQGGNQQGGGQRMMPQGGSQQGGGQQLPQ